MEGDERGKIIFAHYTLQTMSQPGGRTLNDLFAIANSVHGRDAHAHLESGVDLAPGERHDHLRTAESARAFLRAQGIRIPPGDPTASQLRALRVLRVGVHSLAGRGATPVPGLSGLLAEHRYRLDASGRFRPEGRGWSGLIADVLVVMIEVRALGPRLKRCANSDCGWMFVDLSKNQSRQWCEMRTCGNRANLRRYRERLRKRRRTSNRT
jgi:CGNR zinc finger protein